MRGVSFDYSDFLTVSRLAVGTQAAILSYGAGNNVLRVSEESRISNIKVSSNLMHQVPLTFLCEGYFEVFSDILSSECQFVSWKALIYMYCSLIGLEVSCIPYFLSECSCVKLMLKNIGS